MAAAPAAAPGIGLIAAGTLAGAAAAGLAGLGVAAPGRSPGAALIGALAGFTALALIAAAYRRRRGRDGMRLGDATLLGAAGTCPARRCGWRLARNGAIPFGPFVCLATWIVFLPRGDMLA
jgi:leader peptidase (prepilin peptidase)/N-methyltransferase